MQNSDLEAAGCKGAHIFRRVHNAHSIEFSLYGHLITATHSWMEYFLFVDFC